MKKKLAIGIFIFVSGFSFLRGTPIEAQVLSVDQIKAGMKGIGRTVFAGNKIEEFNVEILGVLHNWAPKKDLILARLEGGVLERTGVMEGMSGSPVYIDGKLIGAVSYSIASFSKDALSGITPIEEMLKIEERELPKISYSTNIPVKKHMTLDDLFEVQKEYFTTNSASVVQGQTLTPLSIPLVFSGFSPRVLENAKPFFSRIGFAPISAGLSGQTLDKIPFQDTRLRGGDPVGAQLISGDMDMTAIGTVTYVEGDKVLAFGHPLYNLGGVDYIMTKARVLTVIPSLQTSSKLAVSDIPVGRFTQDRNAGIFGEIGKSPRLIPMNIRLINENDEKTYQVNIIDDKILTPSLVNVVVSNILYSEERSIGDLSLEFRGTIFLENGMNIRLEDLFSGNYDSSATNLSSLVASIVFYLSTNEFRDLAIHRIDLAIKAYEGVKVAFLEKVMLDKYDVSPGERIQLKIYTRNFRGEGALQDGISFQVPNLPSGSEFYLVVADSKSLQQVELGQYRTQAFMPRSLNQLIRLLSGLRKNNRIYVKIIGSKPGLFLKGEELPNLPPSMKTMFSSSRASSTVPTELKTSTLGQFFQHPQDKGKSTRDP
ncbi:SpoIVB peptidase S55 domain-containing protein [Acidobacteriota bacterium]